MLWGLIVFGAFGSATLSASLGVSALYATHVQAYDGLGPAWLIYYLGDSTGVLLVTPLVFVLPSLLRIRPRSRIVQFAALLVFLTAACFIIFGDLPFLSVKLHILAFAMLPFVIWAAIAFGVAGAAVSTFLIATIATVETALGSGPFAANSPIMNAVLLDVFFGVLAVSGLTLAAVTTEKENAERAREELVREQAAMEARDTERKQAEKALRQKGKELSEAQRLAGVGSWYWDAQNDIVTWSEELYRIAGLDPTLPAPNYKECPRHLTAESWERLQRAAEQTLRYGTPYELDLEMIRPHGTTRWVTARAEAVADTTGRIVGLRGTTQDITERKLAQETLADMSRKLLEAQEQERTRIARELHDDINQQLALLSGEIHQVKEALPVSAGELRNRVDELGKRTSEISSGVQSLSHELHSSRLEYLGVVSAIRGFCKELGDKQKVKVDFQSEGVPRTVSPEVSLCLFRVVQEGLHNAVKHSGVRSFEVRLHGSPGEIHLTVRDSGMGFDPELVRDTQGLGFVSMQERVRLVNGSIVITSKPGSGTEIDVRAPLQNGTTIQANPAGG